MDEARKVKVEELLRDSKCPKGCRCYHVHLEELCKARSFGIEALLECLEEDPRNCAFAFPFGGSYFCKCSVRKDFAKILEDE